MTTIRTKRLFLLLFFIHLCIAFFVQFSGDSVVRVVAEEDVEASIEESMEDLLDGLDLKALQEYVDSLENLHFGDVKTRLLSFVKGEVFRYEQFGQELLSILFENVTRLLPSFACIAAISLLSGLLSTLQGGFSGKTTGDILFLISYAAALIPLIGVLSECFETCIGSVTDMQKQMQIVFPLLLTLMAASGGAASVAVCKPAVSFFSTVIVGLVSNVVLPLTVTVIAFTVVGNMTKELRIGKFTAFFKSINKWILGISISVFGLFFTLQGLTSSTYDGIVRRAAKYALGAGVPIVGGFLSGSFDLVVAGSILVRNSLGGMSIFLLLSNIFEPLVLLISVNLLLRFTAAVVQPFGDSRISDFLEDTATNMQYCTASLLFTAFLYFLTVIQIISGVEMLL